MCARARARPPLGVLVRLPPQQAAVPTCALLWALYGSMCPRPPPVTLPPPPIPASVPRAPTPSSFELERIYDTILNLLLKMPAYRFVYPALVDGVVLSLLHVLREALAAHPVPDPGLLACLVRMGVVERERALEVGRG